MQEMERGENWVENKPRKAQDVPGRLAQPITVSVRPPFFSVKFVEP
jgi:hypothetical protein